MSNGNKTCREVMVDVFDFPHVPYWFTLRQVAGILKKSLGGDKCLSPASVLVFDEKYNLVGHLDIAEILKRLQPLFTLPESGETPAELKALSEIPASDMMIPSRTFADPDDTILTAAALMTGNNISMLPVLEQRKKLVGIVRTVEIFKELTMVFFNS